MKIQEITILFWVLLFGSMYLVSVDPMDRSYISNFQAYITGYDYFHDNEEAKIRSYIRDLNLSEIPKYVPDCFNVLVVQGN